MWTLTVCNSHNADIFRGERSRDLAREDNRALIDSVHEELSWRRSLK